MGDMIRFLLSLTLVLLVSQGVAAQGNHMQDDPRYDPDSALTLSQAAIGTSLPDLEFTDSDGNTVRLSSYSGKPLMVSMIFTSCHHVCPAITRHLRIAVETARQVLGDDSFQVLTVGFDTVNDTPDALRNFARAQGVDDPHWDFVSGSDEAVAVLSANLGFTYFPTPRGFDHINQLTLVDREGVVYTQVYGGSFELPAMMEPLKDLVFNRPADSGRFLSGLIDRIRLFCTVYDPTSGAYKFDYSLFVGMAIGFLCLLAVLVYLIYELRQRRRTA